MMYLHMKRCISVLGSTGSIGRQSLDVMEKHGLSAAALTAHRDVNLMEQQARRFKPRIAVMTDERAAKDLRVRLADTGVRVLSGEGGLCEAASIEETDTVVTAVVGTAGLLPTMAAIKEKKRIALANKETLVCAGSLVMRAAREYGAEIVPVDSEHSAIFQCLDGSGGRGVKRILLTASGGPFRGRSFAELESMTAAEALKHPTWSMGKKVTVDSSTMMNKGLEFIEAMHLFSVTPDKIKVLVHPQSIVHSMVEFEDNAVVAQLGVADMRIPIQYALTYPERLPSPAGELDFTKAPLTFEEPDTDAFRCLALARECAERGGTACAVMNGANEAAVGLFLEGKIGFNDIWRKVSAAVERLSSDAADTIEDVLASDREAKRFVLG